MAYKNSDTITNVAPNLKKVKSKDGAIYYLFSINYKGTRINQCNLSKYFPDEVVNDKTAKAKVEELKVLLRHGVNKCLRKELPSDQKPQSKGKLLKDLVEEELAEREVSPQYLINIKSSYNKHMAEEIGDIDIQNITMPDLKQQINIAITKIKKECKKQSIDSDNVILNIKKILRPVFDLAVDLEYINANPFDARMIKKTTTISKKSKKPSLDRRLKMNGLEAYIEYANNLYTASLSYKRKYTIDTAATNEELQLAFILSIMTARRTSEILQLRYEHISNGIAKPPLEITKTGIEDDFPLPEEFLKRIDLSKKGLIFPNIKMRTYHNNMRSLISSLNSLRENKFRLYGHDKRNLFSTIMSKITNRHDAADALLSHHSSIKETYQAFDIEFKKAFFNVYWEVLRTGKAPKDKIIF